MVSPSLPHLRPAAALGPRLRALLPHGHGLPEDLWTSRHTWILRILCAHIPVLIGVGIGYGYGFWHAVQHVVPLLVLVALATLMDSRRATALIATIGLLTCSALLVHLTGGLIEAHFHFFVVMTILAFYEDWAVYGLAVAYVALHHGVAGALLSDEYPVFAHLESPGVSPWAWATLHAGFILASGVANMLLWRMNENSRALASREAGRRARAEAVTATLVNSLVPDPLPELAGTATVSATYVPGEGAVGGDFYEVIQLEDGRIGIGLGDVAGHGVRAAALTSKLRHTLRAYAADGLEPACVMDKLERALGGDGSATCAYLVIDPAAETVTSSLAGHLPPMVRTPDGRVDSLAGGLSVPLAGLGVAHVQETRPLQAGSTLIVYTDGLVERRDESIDAGMRRLRQAVAAIGPDPRDLCRELPLRLLDDSLQVDDMALVALRTNGDRSQAAASPAERCGTPARDEPMQWGRFRSRIFSGEPR